MPDRGNGGKSRRSALRVFSPHPVSAEDRVRVDSLGRADCPRRYCWWWHSLTFDWDVPVSEGCTFLAAKKHPDWRNAHTPCCRADEESRVDHFEPRDSTLAEDAVSANRFLPRDAE